METNALIKFTGSHLMETFSQALLLGMDVNDRYGIPSVITFENGKGYWIHFSRHPFSGVPKGQQFISYVNRVVEVDPQTAKPSGRIVKFLAASQMEKLAYPLENTLTFSL